MTNFKRMHLIGGTLAIIFLILQSPKWWDSVNQSLSDGVQLAASIGIGGYFMGCVLGLFINLLSLIFRKD